MGAEAGIYRRISVRFWTDERVRKLTPLAPSGQALWLYLLSGPHTSAIPGVFVCGRAALAEALDWDLEAFDACLAQLTREGLVRFDKASRLWFIPNALRHNPPANPNVVTGWRNVWMLLPEGEVLDQIGTTMLATLQALSKPCAEAFAKVLGKAFAKPLAKASGEASETPSPKQEQEQEQEQEQKQNQPSSSASPTGKRATLPTCDNDGIVAAYHDKLPQLPPVRLQTEKRLKAMRKRWQWVLSERRENGTTRASTAAEAMDWFTRFFERATHNDFIMGRTPPSPGHESWRADLDFLLSDKGLVQVLEKTEVPA